MSLAHCTTTLVTSQLPKLSSDKEFLRTRGRLAERAGRRSFEAPFEATEEIPSTAVEDVARVCGECV